MKKKLILFLLQLLIVICVFGRIQSSSCVLSKNDTEEFVFHQSDTTYRIINSGDNSYGYEILVNGRVVIRQLNVPGMPGVNGFRTKKDAKKIAELVLNKLQLGMMPPSIEKTELEKLKIKY